MEWKRSDFIGHTGNIRGIVTWRQPYRVHHYPHRQCYFRVYVDSRWVKMHHNFLLRCSISQASMIECKFVFLIWLDPEPQMTLPVLVLWFKHILIPRGEMGLDEQLCCLLSLVTYYSSISDIYRILLWYFLRYISYQFVYFVLFYLLLHNGLLCVRCTTINIMQSRSVYFQLAWVSCHNELYHK